MADYIYKFANQADYDTWAASVIPTGGLIGKNVGSGIDEPMKQRVISPCEVFNATSGEVFMRQHKKGVYGSSTIVGEEEAIAFGAFITPLGNNEDGDPYKQILHYISEYGNDDKVFITPAEASYWIGVSGYNDSRDAHGGRIVVVPDTTELMEDRKTFRIFNYTQHSVKIICKNLLDLFFENTADSSLTELTLAGRQSVELVNYNTNRYAVDFSFVTPAAGSFLALNDLLFAGYTNRDGYHLTIDEMNGGIVATKPIGALSTADLIDTQGIVAGLVTGKKLDIAFRDKLVNDLTTGGAGKALSAMQGKILKAAYDQLDLYVKNIGERVKVANNAAMTADTKSPDGTTFYVVNDSSTGKWGLYQRITGVNEKILGQDDLISAILSIDVDFFDKTHASYTTAGLVSPETLDKVYSRSDVFTTMADAQAATIQPKRFIIIGKGNNYNSTYYHHGTTAKQFSTVDYANFTLLSRATVELVSTNVWLASDGSLSATDTFLQYRTTDSKLYLYQVPNSWTGTTNTGAVWNAAEEARYIPVSEHMTELLQYLIVDKIISAPFPTGDVNGVLALEDGLTGIYTSNGTAYGATPSPLTFRNGMEIYVRQTGETYHWNSVTGLFVKQVVTAASIKIFDAVDEIPSDGVFTDGELIITKYADGYYNTEKHCLWVFSLGASDGDFSINTGYFHRQNSEIEWYTEPADGGAENTLNFIHNNKGGGDSDAPDPTILYFRRHPTSTGKLLTDLGTNIEADDFNWHIARKLGELTFEYVGSLGSATPTGTSTFTGVQRTAIYDGNNAAINITKFATGLDIINSDFLEISLKDAQGTLNTWGTAKIDVSNWGNTGTESFFVWNYDNSYILGKVDIPTGEITLTDTRRETLLVSISSWKNAANGFVIPTGTTIADEATITVNGGTVEINDQTSYKILKGVGAYQLIIKLPVGKQLATVTNATIVDASAGVVAVQASAGGVNAKDLVATFVDKTTTAADIVDNATTGSLQVGDSLIQWGTLNVTCSANSAAGGTAVTFPTPFASTPSIVITTGESVPNVQYVDRARYTGESTTGFIAQAHRVDNVAGGSVRISWQAIGVAA